MNKEKQKSREPIEFVYNGCVFVVEDKEVSPIGFNPYGIISEAIRLLPQDKYLELIKKLAEDMKHHNWWRLELDLENDILTYGLAKCPLDEMNRLKKARLVNQKQWFAYDFFYVTEILNKHKSIRPSSFDNYRNKATEIFHWAHKSFEGVYKLDGFPPYISVISGICSILYELTYYEMFENYSPFAGIEDWSDEAVMFGCTVFSHHIAHDNLRKRKLKHS